MRKLKAQVQITMDGFVGGANGEMDWMKLPWSADLTEKIGKFTEGVDCILLGRKLAQGFIPYWASVAADSQNPEQKAGQQFTNTSKIVFSKTLKSSEWDRTTIAEKGLVETVNKLKRENGKDIVVYGGATLLSALLEQGLVDELNLYVNPVTIGQGLKIFYGHKKYAVQSATLYECGITGLVYTPTR